MKPKVSIICTTYNHKDFIGKALDSFVMQKTNFPFEVIVHDDASTDGTTEIIRDYEKKYPDIIKPIYQKENQFSQGKDIIIDCMLEYIQGEYVAMNEGDDFWIDENKLQRQVDFLDANPDFSVCFHPVKVVWEDNSQPESIFPTSDLRFHKDTLTLKDLLKHNFIQTNSVMYRWCLKKEMWPQKRILPCDYLWHLLHAKHGKIGFLPQVMSVYRRNQGGIWTGAGETDEWFLRCGIPHIRFFQILESMFNIDQTNNIIYMGHRMIHILLQRKDFATIEQMSEEFSELWEKFIPSLLAKNDHKKQRRLKRKISFFRLLSAILFIIILYLIVGR
ncbi:glycosyltransferase family 2 protein [Campylobacter sp. P0109]|uniref:glycosyltransferase family 2 protein n=1 Tax=Campylobacter sp. P0109 TaxID=1895606 RepID=UPI000A344EC4|nr:glycosyltransferase [Campylobacter sp. P0109]